MQYTFRYLMAILVVIASQAFGQTPGAAASGTLRGQVTGNNGQILSDVSVRVENASGEAKRATTGADGHFTIEGLSSGSYTVMLERGGRTIKSATPLTISGGGVNSINLSFNDGEIPGTQAATLEVKASAPTIQNNSAQVSRAYETGFIRALPLLDRQSQQLTGLMPGVTPPVISEDRIEDPQATRSFNVNGLPAHANAYFQDGSYQVEAFHGRPSRIAPNESIQQMNVLTSNYNGEFGFSAGSWTNTVTRPGTNGVHGSAFGLNTNRFFVARNPLNTSSNDTGFNRNQFGGSIGTPIVGDKTFFFGAYEGLIRRGQTLQLLSVPSADFRAGNFSGLTGGAIFNPASGNAAGNGRVPFPGGQIPASALNPTSLAQLPQFGE